MKVTITRAENRIEIDGRVVPFDLTGIDSSIDLVQWFGANGTVHRGENVTRITSLAPFAAIVAAAQVEIAAANAPKPVTLSDLKVSASFLIDAEAGQARARVILAPEDQWQDLEAAIEAARLAAKRSIAAAEDATAIDAALEAIVWPTPT